MFFTKFAAVVAVATVVNSCDAGNVPTSVAIQAQIPTALRVACAKYIPAIPSGPTNRSTARYIAQLRYAADRCARQDAAKSALIQKYEDKLKALNGA